MIRLDIPELPPSANTHRQGWRKDHQAKTAFGNLVSAVAFDSGVYGAGMGSKGNPVRMEVALQLGPKARLSDADNRLKALQDALQSAGVLSNDRHICMCEAAIVHGPTDRTMVKLFTVQAPTLDQVQAWWDLPDPLMEQTMGRRL